MRGLLFLGALLLLLVVLWPMARRVLLPPAGRPRAIRDELVKDPVCQTYVLRSRAVSREAGGTTHYFCSRECAERFSE
ncbi:MAG: YHS domain-containing protein [Candidatus Rokubacteria bacterium]|nr:YHS domain-containing protein [Candidatus Rokubacteria bacterium]